MGVVWESCQGQWPRLSAWWLQRHGRGRGRSLGVPHLRRISRSKDNGELKCQFRISMLREDQSVALTNIYISSSLDHAIKRLVISMRHSCAPLRSSLHSSGVATSGCRISESASETMLVPYSRASRRAYFSEIKVGEVLAKARASW